MTSQQGLPPRHNGLSAWTTRRWLRVGVSVALAVLAALGAVGLWTTTRTSDITDELVNTRSPSLTYAVRLEAALVNQETGIRGYGLTGQRDFLDPYRQGVTDQKTAVDRLRELLVDNPQGREDLQQVLDRTQVWEQRIALPIAASPSGAPAALAAERAEEGRNAFDRVRAALAAQQEHVRTARLNAVKNLDRATQLRNWVFIAIACVIVLVAALVFEGLRRGITDPLARLGSDARQVARGNFAHPVATTGPADLRQLGADMEAMRRRLVDELAFSEQARHQLDERAADLKRSNAELEQFAYVASHDLQEPLRKVSSFTQLLQRRYADQLDERADQYIAFAVDGANRMQTLINDLLTFSRVGRVHNEHRLVELEPLVEDTLSTLSISIEESGATISHDALPAVVGDTTQLGMLWQNLISNAIKFRHPDRRPQIHIGASREGDLWRFTVTDNGIGIDPEFADRVFIIFQRLHTKDAYPGSGIGLAMCKKIVEFHGGTIAVDTHRSPGTRISFTLLADTSPTDAEDPRS
ncbi:sensor histidine kinase [Actinacidiphila glaucinigra]|uniref:sensor histidine kinase n=1 Tax=Actinacidiphila glaucinigra TaxID=235986 RepID=UPI002E3592B8|nr:CHASE3 domain-containing protein [Actinacidiphila glaucinigra]